MRQAIITVAAASCLLISGCSSSSDNNGGADVPLSAYDSYNCERLTRATTRIGREVEEVVGYPDSTGELAGNVGIVLVSLPFLVMFDFFVASMVGWFEEESLMGHALVRTAEATWFHITADKEQELAHLTTRLEAIEKTAIQNNCKSLVERFEKRRKAAKEKLVEKFEKRRKAVKEKIEKRQRASPTS